VIKDTLIHLLENRVECQPDRTAYIFLKDEETDAEQLTYQELQQKAKAVATQIQIVNTQKNQRILLIYKPGLEFITAFWGCLYAGAIAVPAYPPRKNNHFERLQNILCDAEAQIVLTTHQGQSDFATQAQDWSELDRATWIATDTIDLAQAHHWSDPQIQPDSLALLQYTSGSTGAPKGVMIQHKHLLANSAYIQQCFQNTADIIGASWLPPYHDMGLIGGILQPIYVGAHTVLMDPVAFLQRPLRWLRAISQYGATTAGGPNFAYALCTETIKPQDCVGLDLSSWRVAFTGAESVQAETLRAFAEKFSPYGFSESAFLPCYGMAEATLIVTGRHQAAIPRIKTVDTHELREHRIVDAQPETAAVTELVSCGAPPEGVRVEIVNPETGQRCSPGTIGEIWVSSDSVAAGYWQQPELTQTTFQAALQNAEALNHPNELFLRTGDLGCWEAGELFVTGRLKELMIIRGRNYYPQDIEQSVQASVPELRPHHGAAFTVTHNGQEELVLVHEVERTHLRQLDPAAILKTVRRVIAEQFDLQLFGLVLLKPTQLPKTTSGKVQRLKCRQQFLSGSLEAIYQSTVANLSSAGSSNPTPKSETSVTSETLVTLEAQPAAKSPEEVSPSNPVANSSHSIQSDEDWQTQIQAWLIQRVSEQLNLDPHELDLQAPLADYGLSSVIAVRLSGDLQDWLNLPLDPTLLYDYPSIAALTQVLVRLKSNANSAVSKTASISAPQKRRRRSDSEIAVIGIGCRFPGANNPEEYWQLLVNNGNAITEVPSDRWDVNAFYDPTAGAPGKMNTRWGGFIQDVDRFDANFFGISGREAAMMDPQQRLLLEVTWAALEQAGLRPQSLRGSQTGVFVGISSNDYARLMLSTQSAPDPYSGTGQAFSIAANRLSYFMDWRGPSLAIDTACSSSLVAIHQATQSLRHQECDLAVAGGVNLILSPDLTIAFSQAQMMSPDGQCKAFDAQANGYVRSEGCGIVVLKRLEDALRDGDTIYAVVKGSAVNQDGRSNGLTAPNSHAQVAVIRQALQNANVVPQDISYVEAHGTGTPLGDPIEITALKTVFAPDRPKNRPFAIGSVKTNIGHLEAAAGIASFIKIVLSLYHRTRVASLHCREVNPLIDLTDSLQIATQGQRWQADEGPRLKGVSAFGFGGTNAHVVVAEAPIVKPTLAKRDRPYHLLTLSAKVPAALKSYVAQYQDWLVKHPELSLGDLCFTANGGRSQFEWRTNFVVSSREQLLQQLASVNDEQFYEVPSSQGQEKVAFIFGEGNPWKLGHQLYQTHLRFRTFLEKCDAILYPLWKRSLVSLLYDHPQGEALLQEPRYRQPAMFAIAAAMADLWMSWGITPQAVLGDGVGELIAAHVAGIFDLPTGLKWVAQRYQLLHGQSRPEQLTAVFEAEDRLMTQLVERASSHQAKIPVISIHTGSVSLVGNAASHSLQVVDLHSGLQTLQNMGCRILMPMACSEIVHSSVTSSSTSQSVLDQPLLWIPSIDPTQPDWNVLLKGAATLHQHGIALRWYEIDRPYGNRLGNLPTYPFARQRYWFSDQLPNTPATSQPDSLLTPQVAFNSMLHQALYTLKWEAVERPASNAPGVPRSWLILADAAGLGINLASALRSKGDRCVLAHRGTEYQELSEEVYILDPKQLHHFENLLHTAFGLDHAPLHRVIHLWSQDQNPQGEVDLAAISQSQTAGCESILNLVKAIIATKRSHPPRLWVVTRGTQQVLGATDPINFCQAALWGLGRVIALEHRELSCTRLDLAPTPEQHEICWLLQALNAQDAEDQIALRQKQSYVLRLVPQESIFASSQFVAAANVRADGTYLITGGLDTLGLNVAQRLVRSGAKHLLLLGRSQPSEVAQATIQSWKRQGIQVLTYSVDVSNATALSQVFQEVQSACPPLRGIIHATEVLDDRLLHNQTWSSFQKVMEPKVLGAWNLHQLSQTLPIDFFVCFSSIAAILGCPGQANYAAANAFLDALMQYRRSLGLMGLSINWGAWSDGDMTADRIIAQRLAAQGIQMIEPEQGLDCLEYLLALSRSENLLETLADDRINCSLKNLAQIGVMPIQWDQFQRQLPAGVQIPFLARVIKNTLKSPMEPSITWRQRLQGLSKQERQITLTREMQQQIARVLRLPNPDQIALRQRLFDLGLDSLVAVELKYKLEESLGRSLPTTLLFDYPTLESLVNYLMKGLDDSLAELPVISKIQSTIQERPDSSKVLELDVLASLSEQDAEALLLQELEKLHV
jgi:acyl transferase domain-containing protein/acyl-CoA synthetase (AMP-forming)/AMP-acid ligase II/acyl carrier protein